MAACAGLEGYGSLRTPPPESLVTFDIADASETRRGPCALLCATAVSEVLRHSAIGGHTVCYTRTRCLPSRRERAEGRELGVQAEEYVVVLERENTVG